MATTYDKASLVMIPSGYKDDKLYSVKPTDGSGDFTFSRDGSGASPATRVNASGYIEKGRENLLLQSNQFDTTWTLDAGMTLTSGQTGYDGSSDAWLLTKPAANFREMVQVVSYSGVMSYSIYAKASSLTAMTLRFVDGVSNHYARFDLSGGAPISSTGSVIDMTMTDVGGGWYRCTAVTSGITGTSVYVYPDLEYNGTTGSIYIQDAQLEQGLVATDYIETTTTAVSAGLLGDMPRLDYSGGATCPSLLLEPSRTNYATQSEYTGGWIQSGVSVIDNFATSPEGVQNASKVSASLTSSTHFIQLIAASVGDDAVISVFAKADTGSYIQLTNPYSGAIFANFDVATGVVGTKGSGCISSDIEDYGNGWYRCTAVFDNTGFTSTTYRHYIVSSASAGFGQSWLPASDTSLFIYGHQWEAGSYPTSYIPTYGSAASRAVDLGSKFSASDLIGQEEGTLFLDFVYGEASSTNVIFQVRRSTGAARQVDIRIQGGLLRSLANSDGSGQFTFSYGTAVEGTRYKVAVRYALNDSTMYVNGTQYGTDTSCDFSAGLFEQITFSEDGSALIEKNYINQALLFKTPLTNAELAALTTI